MDAYKITDGQMDTLYQVKTTLLAAGLIGEYASEGCDKEVTPLLDLFTQLGARMHKVLCEAQYLPDPDRRGDEVELA